MNTYHIKIDGLYLSGFSEISGKAPAGGWYDIGGSVTMPILEKDKERARHIIGNINLKSDFSRIFDAMRYGDLKFEKIEIVKVGEE